MTKHKFTDEEVIKALECCTEPLTKCEICPYEKVGAMCFDKAKIDALALINRQKAEIKRLIALAKLGNMRANDYRAMRDKAKNARAEAIKEFAKRLKKSAFDCDVSFGFGREHYTEAVAVVEIDNLVKEMTEGHDESQNT